MADKDFIVAIELGSSKITGIAGKKKDATMQILAYAEDKTTDCIKRGMVYNIEKTYQCITNIVNKLEATLKTKVARVYIGLGGQSLRSYKTVIKRNMLTTSYITNSTIDAMRTESYEIPYSDYEVLENFQQEYIIDQNVVADPVGVMGTLIEGEYIDIIAKQALRDKVNTCFDNLNIDVVEEFISPCQLANGVLTDSEKRSGCVLVDLGADTTTVVVYKNNICRYLVTIPLGSANINKDLASIQIEGAEAEDVKLRFGDACPQEGDVSEDSECQTYTTIDGRHIEVSLIKRIIESRVTEIVANVNSQIVNSNYSGKLLAGIVLTGGGSNMKNIEKAFLSTNKVEKIRVARSVIMPIAKTSNASNISIDNAMTNTLISLLLAGNAPCGGDSFETDLFGKQQQDEERRRHQEEAAAEAAAEAQLAITFDGIKAKIREQYEAVQAMNTKLQAEGKEKKVRKEAEQLVLSALSVLDEEYEKCCELLSHKDKYKQSLKEGNELADKLKVAVQSLALQVRQANSQNGFIGRIKTWVNDIVNDD